VNLQHKKSAPLDFIGPLGIDEEVPHLGVLKSSKQQAMPVTPLEHALKHVQILTSSSCI
jgi:hypothetical protein